MNKVNEPSIPIAPQSGLITLEALWAAAKAVGLSENLYRVQVSIVPADPVQASVRKNGVDSKENDQELSVLL